jgi:hypothetical protein
MTIKLEEATRNQLAEFLPQAIRKAFCSYHSFMQGDPDDEKIKIFKEHHNAGKVALAHIELLLKLAALKNIDVAKISDEDMQKAVQAYEDHKKTQQ